jgi:hypothetical protein
MEITEITMKKIKIIYIADLLGILGGCHKPQELIPSEVRQGVNSITASFAAGEAEAAAVGRYRNNS